MLQAAILAGGLGLRLKPLTVKVPKPMMLIHGRPFLEYQISLNQTVRGKPNPADDRLFRRGY